MSLTERLNGHAAGTPVVSVPVTTGDSFAELKSRIHREVIAGLGPRLFSADLPETEMARVVTDAVTQSLTRSGEPLSRSDRERLVREISDDIVGYGPLEPLLEDESITEIMVNRPDLIYVERDGRIEETTARFADDQHLRRIIDKIVATVGRRVDDVSPMVDARLPDGSRVNAIVHPVIIGGPAMTIRKFAKTRLTAEDLVQRGSMSADVVEFLNRCIQAKLNILVAGGTGSGKTTLLNVLSSFVPPVERIVTVEDAAELQLHQRHVLRLESRPANVEGNGAIAIRDLVRNALRMRPDRIIVGEVRGPEALDMLQAMNTGHDGSLSTIHCNSPRDAMSRLETMVLMAGFQLPHRAIREQICSALDLIVQVERLDGGARRVTQVTEVLRMEGDQVTLQDLFVYQYPKTDGLHGAARNGGGGRLVATGLRPSLTDKFTQHGVEVPSGLFAGASTRPQPGPPRPR